MPLPATASTMTIGASTNNSSHDIKTFPVKPWWNPSVEAKSPASSRLLLQSSSASSSTLTLPPAQMLTEARERGRRACALLRACLPLAPPTAVDDLAFSDPNSNKSSSAKHMGSSSSSSSNNSQSTDAEPGLLAALVKQLAYGAAAEVAAAARVLTVLLMHRDPSVFCGALAAPNNRSTNESGHGQRTELSLSDADMFLDLLFGLVASGQLASGAGLGQRVHAGGSRSTSSLCLISRRPFEATVTAAAEATALLRLLLGSRPGVHVASPTAVLPSPPPSPIDSSDPLGALPSRPPAGLLHRQDSAPVGDASTNENAVPPMPPRLQRCSSTNERVLHGSSSNNSQSESLDWRSMILARLADGISVRLYRSLYATIFLFLSAFHNRICFAMI